MLRSLGKICLAALLAGCAAERVTIETDVPAEVSIVEWSNVSGKGNVAGKTPVTVPLTDFKGKLLRITSPGKVPQFWVSSTTIGDSVTARFKLEDVPLPKDVADQTAKREADANTHNRVVKLVIKAYQALAAGDFAMAQSLAGKGVELAPLWSAPHIVAGMAALEAGKKAEAKAALTKAKTLDPQDAEIDELLALAQ